MKQNTYRKNNKQLELAIKEIDSANKQESKQLGKTILIQKIYTHPGTKI